MVAAAQVPGVQRVRLSSVEVIHVRDTLLRALREEPKVCPHLHVPMQSGDDARAGGDGPPLHGRGVPRRDPRAAHRGAAGERDDRHHRRLPQRGRGRRSSGRSSWSARRASAGCTRSPTRSRPGTAARGARGSRAPRRRRSDARASCAASRRSARAGIAPRSSARASGCWSTRSPRRSARATPPTTPAATCPPTPRPRASCSRWTWTSFTPTVCGRFRL